MPLPSLMGSLSDSQAVLSNQSSNRSSDSNRDQPPGQEASGDNPGRTGRTSGSQSHYGRSRRATILEERHKPQIGGTTPRRRTMPRASPGPPSPHPSRGETCRCLGHTILLLEELGAKNSCDTPRSLDTLLALLRNALVHFKAVLACDVCNSQGETGVLMAVACQYMVGMYERVIRCCVRMLEDMVSERQTETRPRFAPSPGPANWPLVPGTTAIDGSDSSGTGASNNYPHSEGADDMWFSAYRIESSCERMHVLTTLVTVQTTEFVQLLGRLWRRGGGRSSQKMILVQAEKRTNISRRILRSSLDRAISTKEHDTM